MHTLGYEKTEKGKGMQRRYKKGKLEKGKETDREKMKEEI